MIYLLCMLAGCRLLRGRYRVLALIGSLLCLLLLAMVGWKSLLRPAGGVVAGG
jgi:amino acid efflux transporter